MYFLSPKLCIDKEIHINLGFMGCTHYCLTLKNNYRARLKQNTEWIHLSNHNGNLITGHRWSRWSNHYQSHRVKDKSPLCGLLQFRDQNFADRTFSLRFPDIFQCLYFPWNTSVGGNTKGHAMHPITKRRNQKCQCCRKSIHSVRKLRTRCKQIRNKTHKFTKDQKN